MKTKHVFGTLLLFLFTIGFISCSDNDDDKQDYHLILSENSCEVMQTRSMTVNLTAHENTTLDINNPELIDAAYTWEPGNDKAKIEIKGKQAGETYIVVTDRETEESAVIKVKVTEYPMPRIAAKQTKGAILDLIDFYLYKEDSSPINSKEYADVCDSIVWTVEGEKGSYRVFEHKKGEGWQEDHLAFGWGHCFKYPGEYKTYLTAWKAGKAFYQYPFGITITSDKDFLSYNWSDITKDSQVWTTYADVLGSSPDLATTHGLAGDVPYVEMRILRSNAEESYQSLDGYLKRLYAAPTYTDKKDKMWQLYDELFSEQKIYPSTYPVSIWKTPRANIVLLMLDESFGPLQYIVYAEPCRP